MTPLTRRPAATALAILLLATVGVTPRVATATPLPAACAGLPAIEELTAPPAYYAIDLVPTRRVPGTRSATGLAEVTFAPSPFGVTVTPDGEYLQQLRVRVDGLRPRTEGGYAVWVTTPQLDDVRFLGMLDDAGRLEGRVTFNKYLVVVSLEEDATLGERWRGPIVLRGMSRSGRMHTLAGHGPYQAEPCVKYGY